MRCKSFLMAVSTCLVFFAASVSADVDPRAEFDKKIKVAQVIDVLGPGLAGDSTSLYTGSTSFNAIDVSVPGNNSLAVAIGRSYPVQLNANEASNGGGMVAFLRAFGDWDLDIPFLSGVYSNQLGWEINSTTPTRRCSVLDQLKPDGTPATGNPRNYPVDYPKWWSNEFWSGIELNIPGAGKQSLLVANQAGVPKPAIGGRYHWTTKSDWWFSCLPTAVNNAGGEAFVALSPAGEKYTFNHMSSRFVSKLSDMICPFSGVVALNGPKKSRRTYPIRPGQVNSSLLANGCEIRNLVRKEFFLLPTRVEDRFGNWVQYTYSADSFARLLSITASDGRQITLTYNAQGYVASVSNGVQAWTYRYANEMLVGVDLPDGSNWEYGFDSMKVISSTAASCGEIGEVDGCYAPPVTSNIVSGYVVHPSGARVEFAFGTHFKAGSVTTAAYPVGLVSKSISGVGLAGAIWRYSYSPGRDEYLAACKGGSGCPQEISVDATGPDGSLTRSVFGIAPFLNQGMLLSESQGSVSSGAPVFLKDSLTTYTVPTQGNGFIAIQGVNPSAQGDDPSQDEIFYSERKIPIGTAVTSLQGVQFTWRANAFDRFARPVTVTRFSSLGSSKSDTTTYFDDVAQWVIGQVASVTDQSTGKVVSRTDFDLSTDLPIRSYSFGLLRQTVTYNADGTLASARDGRNNTVTVGSWYRGVPRTIGYPSGARESAAVNPTGTIAATTDELGGETTYGYDAMGRLTSLRYPGGDAVAWTDTLSRFERINVPEYGLQAGHWKRVASTGNGQVSTFYDGRWQPVLTLTEVLGDAATKSFQVRRFDALGHEIFASYALAALANVGEPLQGVSTAYDSLGRVTQVRQDSELGVLTSSTEYLAGFQTRTINPRGFQTLTSYQVFDAPDTSRPVLIRAPEGSTTAITRDVFGKPTQVTRSGP